MEETPVAGLNMDGSLMQNVQLLQGTEGPGGGHLPAGTATIQAGPVTSHLTTVSLDQSGVAETLLNIGQPGVFMVNNKAVQLQISNGQLQQVTNTGEVIFTDAQGQIITSTDGHSPMITEVDGHFSTEGSIISTADGQLSTQGQIIGEIGGQLGDQGQIIAGLGGQLVDAQVRAVGETPGHADTGEEMGMDVVNDADMQKLAADIRNQMGELCAQLADIGEESFLVSVRVRDASSEHLGSVKGDHFCLLHQNLLQEFTNFCLGIEEEEMADCDDDDFSDHSLNHSINETTDENKTVDVKPTDDTQEDDVAENINMIKSEAPRKAPQTPRIIVMKKGVVDKEIAVDHQYIGQGRPKRLASAGVASVVASLSKSKPNKTVGEAKVSHDTPEGAEKENAITNILYLCDTCKGVFSNLNELRDHKRQAHEQEDYHCNKCSRIFSMKKTFERHLTDAHSGSDAVPMCDSCIMEFESFEALEAHISVAHDREQPMKCDVCEQTFSNLNKMMDHRKVHFDYDCFCTKCWQGFFDYLELEVHIQTNCRYKEALYKCDICGKKFTKLNAINKHIDTHPIQTPYLCRMCGRGFDSEKDLKVHRIATHIVRPYKCEICVKTFKRKETLIDHRRMHLKVEAPSVKLETLEEGELEKFECQICGIALQSATQLDQHVQLHSDLTEQHTCNYCDKTFFKLSLLIVHCRKDHKIFLQPKFQSSPLTNMIACDWEGCQKSFDDRTKFKYHMKYHQNRAERIARGQSVTPKPEECVCPQCGKVLKYKSYLKLHMMMHSGERPHTCDICGRSYASGRRLADHIRVHKNERPFKCKVCDKHFTSTSLRNQHMVVHWGHKKFICDVCGKGFMSRKHFHDHMRIHNGELPHRCETCGKDFIYYRSLIRHALTHIDPKERPKPYKCEYCGKEYTEVTGYKHHMRSVHTGENPFQCELCGESFHRNDKLKRHMKSRHNKRDNDISKLQQQRGVPNSVMTHLVTTRRSVPGGPPMIIKTEGELAEAQDLPADIQGQLQIIQNQDVHGNTDEVHVDVIQETSPQVFLIGLGNEGGDSAYLQETQVIEGPDGVRYIIAGSGEELQVIESAEIQQFTGDLMQGDVIQGDVQIVDDGEELAVPDTDDAGIAMETATEHTTVQFIDDQETLTTLANMASVAEVADTV